MPNRDQSVTLLKVSTLFIQVINILDLRTLLVVDNVEVSYFQNKVKTFKEITKKNDFGFRQLYV